MDPIFSAIGVAKQTGQRVMAEKPCCCIDHLDALLLAHGHVQGNQRSAECRLPYSVLSPANVIQRDNGERMQ
jgi:hypothetical protein